MKQVTQYREIMRATRKADCYSGPGCDEIRPLWNVYAEGDKQDDTINEALQLAPDTFPAGTRVTVEIPVCPNCDDDAECCSCGFDWKAWTLEQYS